MSLEEKIGQLFTPMVFSKKDDKHFDDIKRLIEKYHIGGIIFSLGAPVKQTQWLNEFQSMSSNVKQFQSTSINVNPCQTISNNFNQF